MKGVHNARCIHYINSTYVEQVRDQCIQKLGQYADAGNEIRLSSDAESLHDATRIYINVYTSGAEADAA